MDMYIFALVADEPTGTTVAGWFIFLALITLGFGWSAHLFESVLDFKQVAD